MKPSRHPKHYHRLMQGYLLLLVVFFILYRIQFWTGWEVPQGLAVLAVAASVGLVVFHSLTLLGTKATAALFFGGHVLAWLGETIGENTDLPFGTYDYLELLGPKYPAGVPLAIPALWYTMTYGAYWMGRAATPGGGRRMVLLWAAWFMVVWDMVCDPVSIALGAWTWRQPGYYFGVPIQNFAGWWLLSLLILGWYGYACRKWAGEEAVQEVSPWFRWFPCMGYAAVVGNNLFGAWQRGYPGAATATAFVLLPGVALVLWNLSQGRKAALQEAGAGGV